MVKRLFGSFVSAIAYCFQDPKYTTHHHNHQYHHHHHPHHHRRHTISKKSRRPLSLQTVELKVRMCCTGCERVVRDAIHKLKGIDSIAVELEMEKVTVIGYVERSKVLKAVRRAGKRAEFWPYPNPPLYFTSSGHYFKDTTSEYKKSYNYWRHGYNEADRHGALHVTQRGDDRISNFFNDDNVNACRLM
ncbi:heavy metal-associated isoprenylated plant protein 30-like [Andrographis paniculata]|uniref:heavy metal-associated isoprenylated plant protein 30-like n=1 Tax=Andrographis paniculata TaxID=175694 RepID=UPI0021E975D6|nr:heavy metal-associated isoprenylated plant protein 30-like [Andrographis paniculata]